MSILDFFSHKNGNDSSERNEEKARIISFASVENIDAGWVKLLVEKVNFQESTTENFANIDTFEAFVEVEDLPEGTKWGDILTVVHDGTEILQIIERPEDVNDQRKRIVSANIEQILADGHRH